jgi:hypothetical protein
MYVAKDLRQAEPRAAAVAQLAEVLRRFPTGPPVGVPSNSGQLPPVQDITTSVQPPLCNICRAHSLCLRLLWRPELCQWSS